jgi:protein-S-isoprenylcysteine O-methyltransferase Ste14
MAAYRHSIFAVFQILAATVLLWILVTWNTPWNVQRWIGTALVVVGMGLIGLARYQLGKSFAIRAEAHELVTHGLYSKIRNPIYVSSLVLFTGVVLVLQQPVLWIALSAMVVVQVIRARREARVLEMAFGERYREYRRKTWF